MAQDPTDRFIRIPEVQRGLAGKAIKGAGFSISSQVVNYGIQTVGTIVLARLLSPELFGLVAMVESVSLLLQNFGFNGITEAVVQSDDIDHDRMSKLFWLFAAALVVLTLGFIAFSPVLSWFFHDARLKSVAAVLSLTILFGGMTTCHLAILARSMKFHVIAIIQVLGAFLSTGVAVALALKGWGIWSLVVRRVLMQFGIAVMAWSFCRWRPGRPRREAQVGNLIRFSLKTYVIFLVDYLRKSADKILVGKVLGTIVLGHYDRAYQLAGVLPNQLTASLSGVSLASLSRLRDDRENYLRLFAKSLSIIAFMAFPAGVLLTLIGKDLILLLLGPQWNEAGRLFSALGPSVGIVIVYYAIYWLHFSLGRPDRLLRWSTFTLGIFLLAYAVGILFGAMGVAVAYSILFYLLLIPALCYAGRPIGIKAGFFLSIIWKYWAAAFAGAGVCVALLASATAVASAFERLALLARILVAASAYSAAYCALIIILFKGPGPLVELASVIRRFVSRTPASESQP